MKRTIIFLLVIIGLQANCQVINDINLSSGISISKIDWNVLDNILYDKAILGYSTGFAIGYLEHNYWEINSKIGFYQIGGKEKTEYADLYGNKYGSSTTRFYFNYFNFNTTFKVKYRINKFEPYLCIGPRIDWLASSTMSYKSSDSDSDSGSDFKDFNYGLDCKGGVLFFADERFFLSGNIGYSMSFMDISDYVRSKGNIIIEVGLGYKLKK